MKNLSFVLTLLFSLSINSLFASGSYETETKKRESISDQEKSQIIGVLQANEDLMMSFFDYDIKKIAKAQKEVKAKLSLLKGKRFLKQKGEAENSLGMIKEDNDKDKNYEAYHSLSKVLVTLIETYDLGSTYNVYYCPMVKKKWVQNSQKRRKVHNPYAPEMPHCGGQLTEF